MSGKTDSRRKETALQIMKNYEQIKGHSAAAVTIVIWGTTFVSTKVLLRSFTPVDILFIRFLIGFTVLLAVCPKRLKTNNIKHELLFAAAGLCGITLYYLLENIALVYSTASNVGVIVSAAPLFTALISHFITKNEALSPGFFIGFAAAGAGIAIISFDGASAPELNPLGDILALAAAAVWAVYSVLTKKTSELEQTVILTTRRTFLYGIIFMLPALFFSGSSLSAEAFMQPENILNILYLGAGASALCFVTWNTAVTKLGAVKTSVYIYAVPVITVIASGAVLNEPFTPALASGTALTLAGLIISELTKNKRTH